MLSFPGSLKIFIALDPIDMRAGVNTLSALVAERLKETAQSGVLFVFTHNRRRLIKVLYWDGTGMWLMLKRLEQGTFCWPRAAEEGQIKLELVPEAFAMLTDGIDMHEPKPMAPCRWLSLRSSSSRPTRIFALGKPFASPQPLPSCALPFPHASGHLSHRRRSRHRA